MQNRFKSKVLWGSVASLILLIINQFNAIDSEQIKTAIDVILGILVTFGILNNPTNSKKI